MLENIEITLRQCVATVSELIVGFLHTEQNERTVGHNTESNALLKSMYTHYMCNITITK